MSKMATEKRLVDAHDLWSDIMMLPHNGDMISSEEVEQAILDASTVDAVPVDEIRVDIMSLSLENQEAVLNVSICGEPHEVKLPFSKEVAEVVHGRWELYPSSMHRRCSVCKMEYDRPKFNVRANYCPNCGAKMDGGINK